MKSIYQYLIEGGASGHLKHPYDYTELTLRDIKGLIRDIFSGKIEDITEKIDGTNIQATVNSDGEVVFIRNKSDLNSAKGGMSVDDMAMKWADRPSVANTFVNAGRIIEKVFAKIPNSFFNPDKNTKVVANCECVSAGKTNIMPYASDQVDFHDLWIYTYNGKEWENTDVTKKGLDKLEKACEDINNAQITPNVIIKTVEDSEKILVEYIKEIDKIFKEEQLRENNTIEDWKHQRFNNYLKTKNTWIVNSIEGLDVLYERWFNGVKSVNIKAIRELYPDNLQELEELDKKGYKDIVSYCIEPIDNFFIKLGNDVIELCDGLINSSNKDNVVKTLIDDMEEAVSDLKKEGDETIKQKLAHQLQRIGDMKINAAEGIVFRYKGKLMKLTGVFAPLNKIIGYKYKR